MSLVMQWPCPSTEVARIVQVKYKRKLKPFPVLVRDRLQVVLSADELALLGMQASQRWTLGSLALISIFQVRESLTDPQAAVAVADRLSWTYALGRRWDDPDLDPGLLLDFRSRAAVRGSGQRALATILLKLNEQGLAVGRSGQMSSPQRTLAALRDINSPAAFRRAPAAVPRDARERMLPQVGEGDRCTTPRPESAQQPVARQPVVPMAEHTPFTLLTVRERQIAELVNAGRTNQQIARCLCLSPKTIESHLARMFNKLGVCSRAQVAALVSSLDRSAELGEVGR
ncbi:response regulator transcription factor [Streptomyces sp. NPDC001816]|uniref:helix-turn-helix transcriptional regulator n=1 Tax=Streptomyces sp. NPDC001816 TaxID=3364612 RepID=UPI00369830F7